MRKTYFWLAVCVMLACGCSKNSTDEIGQSSLYETLFTERNEEVSGEAEIPDEAETQTNSEEETVIKIEIETETQTETETVAETEPEIQIETETQTETEIQIETETQTEPETVVQTETEEETTAAPPDSYGSLAYDYLKTIVSSYPQRTSCSETEKQCSQWLAGELSQMGYEPQIQEFTCDQGSSQNVIVKKQGDSDSVLIICAHYDCADTQGCDDNGSGVAAVLEAADRLFGVQTPMTIWFCFYGAEELMMVGSVNHIWAMTQDEFNSIQAVINVDSIAAGDVCYVHGGMPEDDGTVSQTWLRDMAISVSDELGLGMTTHAQLAEIPAGTRVNGSDQFHFAINGKAYIYLEANLYSDFAADGKPCHYQTADERVTNGQVMHTEFDNMQILEEYFPGRINDHLSKYTQLIVELAKRISV